MYEELVKSLRQLSDYDLMDFLENRTYTQDIAQEAADAIEELKAKFAAEHDLRVKALNRLCEWCGVCSKENRDAVGCDDIAQLDAIILPRWISVEERLPEINQSVLVCAFGRSVGEGTYRGHDGFHHVWKMYAVAGTYWDEEVTHWMPLPQPPKEDKP